MSLPVSDLIAPHGGALVNRLVPYPSEVERLERVTLTRREAADLDMIASGGLSPLDGFMGKADYQSVLKTMRLANGLPWSLPVCLAVDRVPSNDTVALCTADGEAVGIMSVSEVFSYDKREEAVQCFGTASPSHPGVRKLYGQKPLYLAGQVSVFSRSAAEFPDLALDPEETRAYFRAQGWKRVVGFQTRNPLHRGHEYITKLALESVDGLLLHPLTGETKTDDVPAGPRITSYKLLIDSYYPPNRVLLATFPATMRYAGPREAIWHAISRKNYGCSHFIVGRDHAGIGNLYHPYASQDIFLQFTLAELGVQPLFFEEAFYCHRCDQLATSKTCPHGDDEHVSLSGTRMRTMLYSGEYPPAEICRPEIAQVLVEGLTSLKLL